MSRIGKKPINIPDGVEVTIDEDKVMAKGPKGEISRRFRPEIKIEIKEGRIIVSPKIITKRTNAFWGLTRSLLANMVEGVKEGYEKKLEIKGLGYKAKMEENEIVLMVGFTHPVKVNIPDTVKAEVDKNIITISGVDKELVGQIASKIRKVKKPEPYKGKGIRYLGERVRRKPGKRVVTGAGGA